MELQQILDAINQLSAKIDLRPKVIPSPTRSEQLNELFAALAKAQAEMRIAGLNNENPYFKNKYADLTDIVNASRFALTRHGLAVIQQVVQNEDGANVLNTMLTHPSGQWISSTMRILPIKNDIQSFASYMSYLKRYAYAALVGVVTGDEDDDGEKAVSESRETYAKGTALNTKYNPKINSLETVTKEQIDMLEEELAEYDDIAGQVLDGLKIQSIADMPKQKFSAAITRIREIKNARNGAK